MSWVKLGVGLKESLLAYLDGGEKSWVKLGVGLREKPTGLLGRGRKAY